MRTKLITVLETAFILFLCVCIKNASAARHIKIGGLFDSEDNIQELAFKYVVDAINAEREILPKHILNAKTEKVPLHDSYAVSLAVCNMLKEGVVGIFGPTSGTTSKHVQSICDTKEVPHVETRMDPNQGRGSCLINLYPHPPALSKVFVDLVKAWNWKKFTIMYENSNGFPRLSELFKMYDHKGHVVTFKQLYYGTDNYRPILDKIKKSGETNFVLDCSIERLSDILIQAQQVGIMSDQHSYIITTPDMHTIDMEPFQYGGANITGIRLIDPEDEDVIEAVEFMNSKIKDEGGETVELLEADKLRTEVALMFDAVYVFVSGLKEINTTKFNQKSFDCEQSDSWEHGFTMINYMKTNYLKGLTRGIKFDHAGFRTDFMLDIVELNGLGLQKIGTWNSTENLNLTRANQVYQIPAEDGSLLNRSFIVLTALSPPYGMLKDSSLKLEGNERFEGFGIEVIQEIAKMLGFNYTFVIQNDGVYGSLDRDTKQWNGMVRELLDWRADLAITDLTITSDRESAVDFTMPFMNLGISILYKKPTKQPPSLFSFMSPFSNEVWLFLGTAYLGVSVLLFVMARIAPKEWQNPYPCIEEPEHLENQFSMPNSLWFTVGSVLQQGSELAPIAISTRMIAGVWWFFTLIIVSSYTANLAAFLTIESITPLIDHADDLPDNPHGIVYGAKRDGSTLSFFKDSDYPTYQKMYQYMKDHPEALTGSNNEGVNRVKNENYAYLMESTSIEYIIERECDITQIGGLLDDKGYGIAMRKNSPYRNTLSTAVLKLQEQGKLQAMKIKWWKEKRGGGACSDEGGDDKPADLGLPNVGGVFVLLVGGCIVASITACGEMIYGIIRNSYKHKVPFRQELIEEWRFVAKCSGDTKPVRHRRSSSQSSRSRSKSLQSGSSKSKEDLNEYGLRVPENGNAKIAKE